MRTDHIADVCRRCDELLVIPSRHAKTRARGATMAVGREALHLGQYVRMTPDSRVVHKYDQHVREKALVDRTFPLLVYSLART